MQDKKFSIAQRAKSITHAWRGIWLFMKTTHNAWLHVVSLIVAIAMGFYFEISRAEWMALILAGGFVLAAEAFNTAIEIDMNLTSPDFHPFARDAKDVAAGAVLITSLAALVIGIFIFWPYISLSVF
ncbi:MAG: diacylglycerol kinase family protein [Patescibacteria group bacterium]